MMRRTDRYFRLLLRQLTRRTLLYTEMVTTGAVQHGDRDKLLAYWPDEHPIALQLGGYEPSALAECARIASEWGYDEVNLNVGCPSHRVQSGRFGACLMREPDRVATAVSAMRDAAPVPVTVKHRIGVDDLDRYEDLVHFVETVARAGCDRFTVHARKAWLEGLNPKQNRTVPPLRHAWVHRLKAEHPELRIELNGGLTTISEMQTHLCHVDGVMVGRAAFDNPYLFVDVDAELFGETSSEPRPTRIEAVETLLPHIEATLTGGTPLVRWVRPLLTLFGGQPGTRAWKRMLTEGGARRGAGVEVIVAALDQIRRRL